MIEIRRRNFSIDEIIGRMQDPKIGAVSIYLGTVREFPEGVGMEFEGDDGAVRELEEIEKRAVNSCFRLT
jgi:molybdopterin synthase catalytic subunit